MSFLLRATVVASSLFVFGIAGLACSSSDDAQPLDNGVDDVKLACEARVTWTDYTGDECVKCRMMASSPDCGCEAFEGFGGHCAEQGNARRAEPTCTQQVTDCRNACAANDCACIDGCYAAAEACKKATAAEDGCIAKICEQYCNK